MTIDTAAIREKAMKGPLDQWLSNNVIVALCDALDAATMRERALLALIREWEHQDSFRDLAYRDDLSARWRAALARAEGGAEQATRSAARIAEMEATLAEMGERLRDE